VLAPLVTLVARVRPPNIALFAFPRRHATDDQTAVSDRLFHLFPAEGMLRLGKLSL